MNNSLLSQNQFDIAHASESAAARRYGQQLCDTLGFEETRAGRMAILITELATNMLKHAAGGKMIVARSYAGAMHAIDVLAYDKGPGIENLDFSFRDGNSSAGTSGNGLGALRRLSDEFDIYTLPGKGSAFFVRVYRTDADARAGKLPSSSGRSIQIGAICIPMHGEELCGDAWGVAGGEDQYTALVSDGLGHGPDAAAASGAALGVLEHHHTKPIADIIQAANTELRVTRGAAMAVAKIDLGAGSLSFAGIGNITGCLLYETSRRQMMSHNGIVGTTIRKIQEFSFPFTPGATCIFHSDGINTQWDLDRYPGLAYRHPALIAVILLRDFERGRDDATVLVIKRLDIR